MPESARPSRWNPFASTVDENRTYWFEILFVAVVLFFGVSRWLENRADQEKRREYLAGIRADLDEELQTNRMNRADCEKDIRALERILEWSEAPGQAGADSIPLTYRAVYQRGVFRAFEPLTIDLMTGTSTGDLRLLKDLPLRQALVGVFGFRDTNLKTAFAEYDAEVKRSAQAMGQFMDLYAMQQLSKNQCIPFDQEGFRRGGRNAIFQLLRTAQVKAFYLEISTESFEELKKRLDETKPQESFPNLF